MFHYCKLLTYLSHDYGSLMNISDSDFDVSGYMKLSNVYAN